MSNAKQARQTTMNRPTLWICGAAVLLATMTLEAQATTLEWNVDANGSLGDAANWNPQAVPSASHDVLLGTIITAARTINVGQTAEESSIWTINSLSVAANATASYRFNWEASPNKTLVVSSGVLSAGGGGPLHHLTTVSDGAFPDRVQLRIPDGLSPTWPIAGDLRIGPLRGDPDNGYSAGTTISKNGTGMLVMAGQSGDFRGALTVAEGSLRIEAFAVHNNLGDLRIEPAHGSDVRLEGGGALRLASGKHVVLAGTTSAEAVVSPGDGAAIGMLTLGSTDGDVSFEDYSRLTVTLHAIAAGSSDTLEVRGRLNLGAPDTANILDIQLQDPNQPLSGTYTLASYVAGLTGTFGAIYYDGELVTDPATAIGDTGYQLVYGGDAVLLKPVEAILVEWTGLGANNRWDNPDNWSTAPNLPAFDGTESVRIVVASAQTQTLDGDRAVLDLDVTGRLTLESGSEPNSRLILTSGNMLLEAGGISYSQDPNFRGIVLQVGDGEVPVDDAVWVINNTGAASLRHIRFGVIKGIGGTVVKLQGNNRAHFNNPCPQYHGDWIVDLDDDRRISLNADNAMGLGTVKMVNPDNNSIIFNRESTDAAGVQTTDHDTRFVLDGPTGIAVMNQRATIRGGLGGTATWQMGYTESTGSTAWNGTLILEGDHNDLSGHPNILRTGTLRLNGLWSNASFSWTSTWRTESWRLEGSGTLALGPDKLLRLEDFPTLAAGSSDGQIGTLTVGTPGNNNQVRFNENSRLALKLSDTVAGESDRVAIHGMFNLAGASGKELRLSRLGGSGKLSGDYTLATYDSLYGTFDRVYLDDVEVLDPTARNGVGDTHQLVYEETALRLVAGPPSGTLFLVK